MSVEEIRQATRGLLVCGSREFEITRVSTDTRTAKPGDFFVAIAGERFDGHDYLRAALSAGACGALYSRDFPVYREDAQKALIKVPDTIRALGDMARAYRAGLSATVVGITGSNGKTTTKEMTRHLIEEKLATVASRASFNNFIGVPLTLFEADASTAAAVIEMGTNHPGEIARLAEIAGPDIGVVTNVGRTHLEGLGSIEGVASAKAELLHGLSREGSAILNADDFHVSRMRAVAPCKVFTFAQKTEADVFATGVERNEEGFTFLLNGSVRAHLRTGGLHNVSNALAAVAVARRLGLDLKYLAERLGSFRLPPMRLEERRWRDSLVINDAYNANPESMARAIEEFAARRATRRIFIFGDMCELGGESAELHREMGRLAAAAEFDLYWGTGTQSRLALEEIAAAGIPRSRARHFGSADEIARALEKELAEGDAALIKGSRAMGLERILSLLG